MSAQKGILKKRAEAETPSKDKDNDKEEEEPLENSKKKKSSLPSGIPDTFRETSVLTPAMDYSEIMSDDIELWLIRTPKNVLFFKIDSCSLL
jgi:hypothetical protein